MDRTKIALKILQSYSSNEKLNDLTLDQLAELAFKQADAFIAVADTEARIEHHACILNLKPYMERLAAARNDRDVEAAHIEADQVLCDLLETLGYKTIVEKYMCVDKWSA